MTLVEPLQHGPTHVRITEAPGRGGGREPPGTHNVCRTRDTRRSSEARPRADPGPAGSRVSPPPGRRPRADTHTGVLYTRHKSSRRGPPCSWMHKTPRRALCTCGAPARARRCRRRHSPCTVCAAAHARRGRRRRTPCRCCAAARVHKGRCRRSPCTCYAAAHARRGRCRRSPCTCCAAARARTSCCLLRSPCTCCAAARESRASGPSAWRAFGRTPDSRVVASHEKRVPGLSSPRFHPCRRKFGPCRYFGSAECA